MTGPVCHGITSTDLPSETSLCLKDKVTSDIWVSDDSYQPPAVIKLQVGNRGVGGRVRLET